MLINACRIRVVFVANSCDVNVEHAIIEHVHNDSPQTYKPDSIRTLSSDVKAKISLLEKAGMTATKIRRHLFKEFQITGAPLPTLKQIQNYVGRLRFKRPSTSNANLPQTPSAVSETSTNTGEPVKRKRGRPRLSEQRQKVEAPIQFPLFNLEQTAKSSENSTKQEESEQNDSTMMTEQEILQKLSEFLCSSQQTPATLAAKKLEENPPLKHARLRLAYHFEKSFPSTESFNEWWSGPRSDSMIHNSTYMNNAAERIDIYRCSKRDCRHRVRVVINPTDNTVCVERTDMDHDISIHDAKSSLSKKAKDIITQLFETGMKPKDMLNHFLQNKVVSSDEIPTLTQIKNLCNRLKIKQKEPSPPIPTTLNDILLK
ncbi:hypothetical protein M3Y97_00159000 [Aphelenchoides bicaudatus]|nr:hypothetical protein M3Y97_00159000 [Aphelenchoides bicaudatus]